MKIMAPVAVLAISAAAESAELPAILAGAFFVKAGQDTRRKRLFGTGQAMESTAFPERFPGPLSFHKLSNGRFRYSAQESMVLDRTLLLVRSVEKPIDAAAVLAWQCHSAYGVPLQSQPRLDHGIP